MKYALALIPNGMADAAFVRVSSCNIGRYILCVCAGVFFHLNRKIVQRRAAALCEDPMAGKVEFDISESVKGVIVGPFVTLTMRE